MIVASACFVLPGVALAADEPAASPPAHSGSKARSAPGGKGAAEASPGSDAKAPAKPAAKATKKVDPKAGADKKADAKADVKADAKADVKTDAKTDSAPNTAGAALAVPAHCASLTGLAQQGCIQCEDKPRGDAAMFFCKEKVRTIYCFKRAFKSDPECRNDFSSPNAK